MLRKGIFHMTKLCDVDSLSIHCGRVELQLHTFSRSQIFHKRENRHYSSSLPILSCSLLTGEIWVLSCGWDLVWKETHLSVVRCLILDIPEEHPLPPRGQDQHRPRPCLPPPSWVRSPFVDLIRKGAIGPHYFPLISNSQIIRDNGDETALYSGALINICQINEWINSMVVQKSCSMILAIYFVTKA